MCVVYKLFALAFADTWNASACESSREGNKALVVSRKTTHRPRAGEWSSQPHRERWPSAGYELHGMVSKVPACPPPFLA